MKSFELEAFMRKSLMSNDIAKEIKYLEEDIKHFENILEIKTTMPLQIDESILRRYYEIEERLPFSTKKVRKSLLREKANIEASSKFFKTEYEKFSLIIGIRNDIKNKKQNLENVKTSITRQIELHVQILTDNGFIQDAKITEKGLIAANIQEMHCLALADILQEKLFDDLELAELAAVLSIFTSVSVKEADSIIKSDHIKAPVIVKKIIKMIKNSYNKYYDIESLHKTDFVNNYDIHYNMCELVYRWCKATNEEECYKIFTEALYYNISRGEFVKAILKINNISHELEKLAELQSNMSLLEKVKLIPDITLKSIANNQSLYL
jgi:superfamily II RNA helicase